jgi:hypothetical protein
MRAQGYGMGRHPRAGSRCSITAASRRLAPEAGPPVRISPQDYKVEIENG